MAKKKTKTVTVEAIEVDIGDLTPQTNNANRGTERGDYMLGRSLEKHGAARGIVVDRNGVIVAGNKTHGKAGESDTVDRVLLIPSDGRTLIATLREDWDLADDDPDNPAREYAIADNRIGQVNLNFDGVVIVGEIDAGVDLSDLWFDDELAEIRAATADGETDDWLDDYDDLADGDNVLYRVVVDGLTKSEADALATDIDGRVEQYRATS